MAYTKDELIERLDKIRHDHVDYLSQQGYLIEIKQDQLFYHYTNLNGVCGIINSKTLWATNAYFLNDYSELRYGVQIVLDVLKEIILEQSREDKRIFVLNRFAEVFPTHLSDTNVYIVSFCTKKDLLSQWKGYAGANGGVSLGFTEQTFDTLSDRHHALFLNVIYDVEAQKRIVRSIFYDFMDLLIDYIDDNNNIISNLNTLCYSIASALLTDINIFKHPSYLEENELRFIVDYNTSPMKNTVKYRTKGVSAVPYIELNICKNGMHLNDVIREMCVGPYRNVKELHEFFHFLIQNEETHNCVLSTSQVPYRTL